MKSKLAAILAVRNTGSRLYGKPLQNLDIKNGITILDYIIRGLKQMESIDEVALAISEGSGNVIFKEYASKHNIPYIIGDENDVLGRLIICAEKIGASDVFRITSESPFPYYENIPQSIDLFYKNRLDALLFDEIIDGCGFEILSLSALKKSHQEGERRHKSELCTLYIRENMESFRVEKHRPQNSLIRKDLRLTVDYPEDLIVCRKIYEHFHEDHLHLPILDIVQFLDDNPDLRKLIAPYTDLGYQMMYK